MIVEPGIRVLGVVVARMDGVGPLLEGHWGWRERHARLVVVFDENVRVLGHKRPLDVGGPGRALGLGVVLLAVVLLDDDTDQDENEEDADSDTETDDHVEDGHGFAIGVLGITVIGLNFRSCKKRRNCCKFRSLKRRAINCF